MCFPPDVRVICTSLVIEKYAGVHGGFRCRNTKGKYRIRVIRKRPDALGRWQEENLCREESYDSENRL